MWDDMSVQMSIRTENLYLVFLPTVSPWGKSRIPTLWQRYPLVQILRCFFESGGSLHPSEDPITLTQTQNTARCFVKQLSYLD